MLRIQRLDRYLVAEILPPFGLGFASYTFLLVLKSAFDLADRVLRADVSPWEIFRLLAWSLPHIVVLTLPIGFLLGLLVGLGRLASESEMTAFRSAGVSFRRVLLGLLPLALLLVVLDVWLMASALPAGNRRLQERITEIGIGKAAAAGVRPRVFQSIGAGTLYVGRISPGDAVWERVFLAERVDPTVDRITVASRGFVRTDPETLQVWLDLQDSASYELDLRAPERHQVMVNSRQSIFLDAGAGALRDKRQRRSLGFRLMTPSELLEASRSEPSPERRREAMSELQKKFSIPAAAIAFLLAGVPLGLANRRGGKGSGFAVSIGLVAAFYLLLIGGESWGVSGRIPAWLGPWVPNLLFLLIGVWMFIRLERDLPLLPEFGGLWKRPMRRTPGVPSEERDWQAPAGPLPAEEVPARSLSGESPSRLKTVRELPAAIELHHPPRRAPVFPTLLDRYLTSSLIRILLLAVSSILMLFLLVDFTQSVDDFRRHAVPFSVIAAYYRLFGLQVLHDTVPFSFLIAALVTLGIFGRRNELIAAKASGVSLYRLTVPVVLVGIALGIGAFYYQDRVLPAAAPETARLRARLRGKDISTGTGDIRWFAGESGSVCGFRAADRRSGTILGLSVFVFSRDGSLLGRIEATQAEKSGRGWIVRRGWERRFENRLEIPGSYRTLEGVLLPPTISADLDSLVSLAGDDLSLAQLATRIEKLESAGYDVRSLRFQYHYRTSAPFAAIVLGILAVPFAARLGRRGTMAGIGVGLGLGMAFLTTVAAFSMVGDAGRLPAALAAWAPYVLFGLAGAWFLLGAET